MRRAEGGWLVIGAGERSPCPHHNGLCAYDGTEPGRCPICHAPRAAHDATMAAADREHIRHHQRNRRRKARR
jgi:hypothetical protein